MLCVVLITHLVFTCEEVGKYVSLKVQLHFALLQKIKI